MNLHVPSADLLAQEIDQLNNQAKTLAYTIPKEAEQLVMRAYALAQSGPFAETPYQRGMAESTAIRCRCYIQYADYLHAIDYGNQAIALCEVCGLPYLVAETSGNVGYAYTRIGQYVDGLRYQLQQEQLALHHGYRKLEAAAYLGRGIIYSFIGDLPKAMQMEKACLAIFQEIGDRRGIMLTYTNLSHSYNESGEYTEALQCGLKALTYGSDANLQDVVAITYINVGRSYKEMKAFTEAQSYLEKALAVAEATGNALVKLFAHWDLGRLAQIQQEPALALGYLQTALQEATEQEQKLYQYESHYTLSEIYDQLHDPAAALAHFRAFHNFTPYRFDEFCCQLQAALAKITKQTQRIQFSFPESTIGLAADFDLVKRILFSLLVNAIKFSDAVAPVLIRCTHTDRDLLLQVSDHGIGIPHAEIERIFDLFYRASNVDTRRGIGLGLSVVQKIIQVLHGTVRAESPGLNQGSTFYVTLPLLPTV